MAGKLMKVRMNSAGAIAVLQSEGVQADLAKRAARIQAVLPTDAGEEWTAESFTGRDRAQAIVRTGNTAARRTAAETPATMIRALAAGTGR